MSAPGATGERDPEVAWVMARLAELRAEGTHAVMSLRSLSGGGYKIGVRYGTTCEELEELRSPTTALVAVTKQHSPVRQHVHVLAPRPAPGC